MKNIVRRILKNLLYKEESIDDYRKRGVKIGNNVDIRGSYIDPCHGFLIEIGDDVTVTGATILTHDASTKKILGYSKVGKVKIGNNVFVGKGAIILPNVRIGNNVVVGAGSVIRSNIPDNSVVIGNPAQIVCTYDNFIGKNKEKLNNKTVPVYNTLFCEKSEEEKELMRLELEEVSGFDL